MATLILCSTFPVTQVLCQRPNAGGPNKFEMPQNQMEKIMGKRKKGTLFSVAELERQVMSNVSVLSFRFDVSFGLNRERTGVGDKRYGSQVGLVKLWCGLSFS